MKFLVQQHRCSLWLRTADGDSALLLACFCGHTDVVNWILDHGASLSERNNAGLTPLLSAANGGHAATVQLLLQRGARVEEKDNDGFTPLLLAGLRDRVDLLRCLLLHGASVHARTAAGLDLTGVTSANSQVATWLPLVGAGLPRLHLAAVFRSQGHAEQWLCAGEDPAARVATPLGLVSATDIASLPLSAALAMPVAPALTHLFKRAQLPWSPERHGLFGPQLRQQVIITLMLARRLCVEHGARPVLPTEIWLLIMSFFDRSIEARPARLAAENRGPQVAASVTNSSAIQVQPTSQLVPAYAVPQLA